jgi:hypothetical protein
MQKELQPQQCMLMKYVCSQCSRREHDDEVCVQPMQPTCVPVHVCLYAAALAEQS